MIRGLGWSLGLLLLSTLEAVASTVYAKLVGGERIAIADVTLPSGGQGAYSFDLDESVLSEHFLSMRPFKCLDLEYRLLFLFKDAGEYGINFGNRYYFQFEQDGDRLIGTRLETNMDQLASPLADGIRCPLDEAELYESEGASHQLLRLVIE